MKPVVFLFFLTVLCMGCDNDTTSSNGVSKNKPSQFFYHNLLIQWKDTLDPEVQEKMFHLLEGIPEQINGFESIEFKPLEPGISEFDHLIIQKYTSKEAEEMYQIHPDHLEAKTLGPVLIAKMTKFDYWGQ